MKASVLCLMALVGCASLTPKQQAMNVDTTALNTYAVIGKVLDQYEVAKCGTSFCDTNGESVRNGAWTTVTQERTRYMAGDYVAALSAYQSLVGLLTTAKGLK